MINTITTGTAMTIEISIRRKGVPVGPGDQECMAEDPLCNDLRENNNNDLS